MLRAITKNVDGFSAKPTICSLLDCADHESKNLARCEAREAADRRRERELVQRLYGDMRTRARHVMMGMPIRGGLLRH